ncbi:TOMM precursor leader peptide-binding protein [Kitasatospora sp. MBT63]|uniref:TOMM precursor leader peptide-binding protein n=1 Tax=Kitasatospora sp. MBT63 TaxID=1444768 RepID=UPI000539650C|nr:TOMM precursor leader peptide-binding protein [Kitasatospora sp. MBT63]
MDDAYEAVAGTRPRIRRDTLFTRTPHGVLFHNADGGFQLEGRTAYRFATLVVPFLTGEHLVAEVCEGLGANQREMVVKLVTALYERGFARAVPPEDGRPSPLPTAVADRFAPQIAYIDHYADGAHRRFHRFRQTRVAVLGDDLVARWCVLSLVRNGARRVGVLPGLDTPENGLDQVAEEILELTGHKCPVELSPIRPAGTDGGTGPLDWADLAVYDTVVTTDGPAGHRQLIHLIRTGIPQGRTLLPYSVIGRRAVVGPLMVPGTAGCWCCAALRLGANDDPGAAADLWSAIALGTRTTPLPQRPGRPLSAMLGNLLGYEVFRLATGALPAETEGQVLLQDLESFDVNAQTLLPHPGCPFCTEERAADDPGEYRVGQPPTATRPTGPGTPIHAPAVVDRLIEQLDARMRLVGPAVGVFRRFTDEPWTQTPLKIGSLSLAPGGSARREIVAFDVHTVAQARLGAIEAAAAVHAEHSSPPVKPLSGTELARARSRMPLLAPDSLATASGTGADPDHIGHWAVATSLTTEDKVLVPAAAVHTFGPHNAERLHIPTGAGTGVGSTPTDAVAHGLRTALAYDALQRALRRAVPVGLVVPEHLETDAELVFLASSARNLGLTVELLDLGEARRTGVHVLLARALDPADGTWSWAVGSAPSWQRSATTALRDLIGPVQLRRDPEFGPPAADGSPAAVDTGDPLLGDFEPATLHITEQAAPGPDGSWEALLPRLREHGGDALAVRTGPADLRAGGLEVVRVILTGGSPHAG